jgi:iron complex outermembrane receptor protein
VSDDINAKNSISLSYSRRIDRPAYQQLDPFVYYLDQYLYEQGNPNLQPQLTHSFSLTYMYKQTYSVAFDYALTTNNLVELFYQVDSTHTTYVTPGNFDNQNYYDVTVYAPFTITKWWNVTPVVTVYYIDQNTNYLDEQFTNSKLSFTANLQSGFQFPKGFSADVTAMYQSAGIWSVATFKGFGEVTAGITKELIKGKARVKLSVSDIFDTNFIDGTIKYANLDGNFLQDNDRRQANLTFTYNFGKQQASRDHRSSDEEEKSRVKTGR